MLTICNIVSRCKHEWDLTRSLHDNIALQMPGGGEGCEVRIDGFIVDPLTDHRMDLPPTLAMHVVVTKRPAGFDPVTWAYIAIAALAVYTVTNVNRGLGGADSTASKDSANNRLTGQSNIARTYQAVPDVYGYRRCWPDLIQPSTIEYVDQVKRVTEWLCVSRGKGDITNVQYAETPIADIDGASYAVFEPVPVDGYPEFGTTTAIDVYEQFASPDVNGQELPYATPFADISKVGTFTANSGDAFFKAAFTDGTDLDSLKSLVPSGTAVVTFTYSMGEFSQNCTVLAVVVALGVATFTFGSSVWAGGPFSEAGITFAIDPAGAAPGATVGPITLPVSADQIWWDTIFLRGLRGSVVIKAEWWKVDDAGVEIGGTRQTQNNTYTDSTYDQRYYTNKVTPSGGVGKYKAQFTRLTVQVDGNGADVAKLEAVGSVRYYATKVFPGCTLIKVVTKATLAATGGSERKFNLRWTRHVRTLTSDTLSASRNFARAMAHVWRINGNDMAQLDTSTLTTINAEFGETSALLRYDGSQDDADMSLGERLQQMAYTARCTVWRDGTKWTVTRDQARDEFEMQFDYRNLAAGGESSTRYDAHLPASFDGVEVEYVDEATQVKKAYVRLVTSSGTPVAGVPERPLKLKLPGCATTSQATNRAQLEARRLLYQRTSVSDTALSDALSLGPLALVRWIDPGDFAGDDGLQAGEVLAVGGLTVTTSEPLDFGAETTGRMVFTGADGRPLGAPILCTPAVGGGAVLASVPTGLYVAGAGRQLGSRYAFAAGLTEAEVEAAGLYTVTSIAPAGNGQASLTLTNYDARIYAAD